MEFTVPQFIERETKIFGPFTFKQFIFIGIAGGISIMLHFMLPFHLFLLAAIVLLGGALALAFLKIGGASLPIVIQNAFIFLTRPKIYLWQKKAVFLKIAKKTKKIKEEKEESPLKVSEKSYLKDLHVYLESKTK